MQAILTVGCSGSGKSTWAKSYAEKNKNWNIIERDEVRKGLYPKQDPSENFWKSWDWKRENEVSEVTAKMIQVSFDAGQNIIISDTNLNKKYRVELIAKLEALGYEVTLKFFNLQYKKLIENDLKRADAVGQQVIAKQYMTFMEQFGDDLGFHKHDNTRPNLESAIIVDIDGTLAMHTSTRSPYDWNRVMEDSISEEVRTIVNLLHPSYKIILMSGRDEVCRGQTIQWLNLHCVKFDELLMRPAGSNTSDFEVKNTLFQQQVAPRHNVKMWFDDRPVIVRLAHILGVKCFAVANPFIEF